MKVRGADWFYLLEASAFYTQRLLGTCCWGTNYRLYSSRAPCGLAVHGASAVGIGDGLTVFFCLHHNAGTQLNAGVAGLTLDGSFSCRQGGVWPQRQLTV